MPKHLPERVLSNSKFNIDYEDIHPLKDVVAQAEKEAIINALNKTRGNKTKAAEKLGIHRTALYKKMNKYNLEI